MWGVTNWNSFLWHFPTLRINHVNKLVSHYQNSPTMCNAEKSSGPSLKIQSPCKSGRAQWSQVACHETDACLLTLTYHHYSIQAGLLLWPHLLKKERKASVHEVAWMEYTSKLRIWSCDSCCGEQRFLESNIIEFYLDFILLLP